MTDLRIERQHGGWYLIDDILKHDRELDERDLTRLILQAAEALDTNRACRDATPVDRRQA